VEQKVNKCPAEKSGVDLYMKQENLGNKQPSICLGGSNE